jgi:predicted O-methyltransferase YrrM
MERRAVTSGHGAAALLDTARRWLSTRGIDLPQHDVEFTALLDVVMAAAPRTYLEIGTRAGGSFWAIGQALDPGATMISVDLPGGPWGQVGSQHSKAVVADALRRQGHRVVEIEGDSHDPAVLARVRDALVGRPIDLLFIDGDHSLGGVRDDWRRYAPLVRPGGLVVFHDLILSAEFPDCRVGLLWQELAPRFASREVVEQYGIGWLRMPEDWPRGHEVTARMASASTSDPAGGEQAHARTARLRARAARRFAIFGAGAAGRLALDALASEGVVAAFVDNDERKWGATIAGIPVVSPATLASDWPDTVVVASAPAAAAIVAQLTALGLGKHRVHVFQPTAAALQVQGLGDALQRASAQVTGLLEMAPASSRSLRLVIFGAGAGGREAQARLRGRHQLVAFADNDRAKAGQLLGGLPIVTPDQLGTLTFDVVVIASVHADAIRAQLRGLGIEASRLRSVDQVLQGEGVTG